MRFKRSDTAPPAPPQPSDARERLLLGGINELAVLNAALMARAERAEEALAAAVAEHADLHPLLVKLGQLAGEALPEVATQAAELLDANSVLATRLAQGDRDLGLLTTALIGDLEPRAFESGNDQNNNEEHER